MSHAGQFAYWDRERGCLREDPIHARRLLLWMHNTPSGRLATRFFFSRSLVSRAYGWWHRRPHTAKKIEAFAKKLGADLDEAAEPIDRYRSFNDFITRRIDLSRRPIDPDASTIVSPVDARIRVHPSIAEATRFELKGGRFDVQRLLDDDRLAATFAGGSALVARLYLADYHHFHFPAAGRPGAPRSVRGRYLATSPYARKTAVPFLTENVRNITLLETERFGTMALIEVGAFTVGSIRQSFTPGVFVEKGAHKGWFELGASVVVLLFEPGRVRFDEDLVDKTAEGLETFVRMGERIAAG